MQAVLYIDKMTMRPDDEQTNKHNEERERKDYAKIIRLLSMKKTVLSMSSSHRARGRLRTCDVYLAYSQSSYNFYRLTRVTSEGTLRIRLMGKEMTGRDTKMR